MQKVGIHIRNNRSALSDLWVANSPYAKALDDVSLISNAPGLKSLRLFTGEGNQQYQSRDPNGFADQMISRAGSTNIILEPTNECGDDDIINYLGWLATFTSHAHSRGYQVAGFSFGEGHPSDEQLWVTIAQHGFAGVDYLGCHNYWPPGPPFEQFHGLRHEFANQVLANAGFGAHPRWLITECGHLDGWATAGLNAQQAAAEVMAYDAHIGGDPSVAAAAVFTRGGAPDFWMFETDPIAQVLFLGGGDPCVGLQCPPGTSCQNGLCVGGSDPCAGVFCPGPDYCVNGACFCPPPYSWIDGLCQSTGGNPGGLDPSEIIGAALIGGVLAGAAVFLRRQLHHPTPVRTFHIAPPVPSVKPYQPTWHPAPRR